MIDYRESTIGAAFLTQTLCLDETTVIKFEIWLLRDTAGQERYRSLAPMYYRNADCAIVVYDITQTESLDKAKSWVKELHRQACGNIVIALAGNKADLASRRAVETSDAQAYAEEAGLIFFETSAKDAQNVNNLFQAIGKVFFFKISILFTMCLAKKLPLEHTTSKPRSSGLTRDVDLSRRSSIANTSSTCNYS
ncbi:unnamed protein product [Pneumocystis jirovecii]|uniref:GTP-binding protein ypt5 n=1 Tax=Pneumocystis jirovecii TaxID=42068 RepID=L0PCC3_PNEJI|nr:unnamed protein product [Pneumocystis jirovecii]